MGNTLTFVGELTVVTCWCGIRHAVPRELRDFQQRAHNDDGRDFAIYCPLGHQYVPSGEGDAARLRRRLEAERDRAARLRAELDQTAASLRAQKGATTKARKRAAAGVCPCCNRTFKQLARHMRSQHPQFVKGAIGEAPDA